MARVREGGGRGMRQQEEGRAYVNAHGKGSTHTSVWRGCVGAVPRRLGRFGVSLRYVGTSGIVPTSCRYRC